MNAKYFSASYDQAKARFQQAAHFAGAECLCYEVNKKSASDLSIDVAIIGPSDPERTLLVTSGVHGVEGFFGSAVQLAWLESLIDYPLAANLRVVLVHAINPYGFRQLRRVNEDNIDLNRNFPDACNNYSGAPQGYALHNRFLNPESLPSRFEFFKFKAALKIWRHGMSSLKESIAAGQYKYPHGLFFGGQGPAESTVIIVDHFSSWLGQSSRVFHMDLHTGLGEYGQYKMLLNESPGSDSYRWFEDVFGGDCIESQSETGGTAYPVNGMFGAWCKQHSTCLDYRSVGVEFGTYDVVRVLKALREENCAHRFESRSGARYHAVKHELLECFCPSDKRWRSSVVDASLSLIKNVCDQF